MFAMSDDDDTSSFVSGNLDSLDADIESDQDSKSNATQDSDEAMSALPIPPSSSSLEPDLEQPSNEATGFDVYTEKVQCIICMEPFPLNETHACSGTTSTHYLCNGCYMGYLKAELQPGGSFAAVRRQTGDGDDNNDSLISQPGELPCPCFITGQCDCASMPLDEVNQLFHSAIRRLVEAETSANREQKPEEAPKSDDDNRSTVQDLFRLVAHAIQEGSWMRCPSCNFPGLKDEACIHINSCAGPGCSTNWCYCCGRHRRRDRAEDCRGCDSDAIFIEHQPGWEEFAQMGSPQGGLAALNEFHRRRIRYYVRRIKDESDPELWQEFRQAFPDVLTGVPTDGMVIEWDELNLPEASSPPVFGSSTETDLLWKLPPLNQRQQPLQILDSPPARLTEWKEVFCSQGGLIWLSAIATTTFLIVLRWFVFDSVALNFISDFLLTAVLELGILFCLLRVAEYNDFNREDNHWNASCGEVQLLGTNREPPYLSQRGRWRQSRRLYVGLFTRGIAYGSFMIAASRLAFSSEMRSTFRFVGVLLLTLASTALLFTTLIVNWYRNRPWEYQRSLIWFSASFSLVCAIGASLLALPEGNQRPRNFGKFLVVATCASWMAEIVARWGRDGSPIKNRHFLCYAFMGSLMVGSTLLSMDIFGVQMLGLALLCGGIVAVPIVWCCVAATA